MKILQKRHTRNLLVILLLLTAVALFSISQHSKTQTAAICQSTQAETLQNIFGPASGRIIGKAFFVYDFSTGSPIYGVNQALPLPLASLTKLMTVRVALEQNVPLSAPYTVTKDDTIYDGPTGFVAGDTYSVEDLIKAAFIPSSNDAATMLAKSTGLPLDTFIQKMNAEARTLNLPSLDYSSVTGLDDGGQATAYGSAEDILALLYKDSTDFPQIMTYGTEESETIRATDGRSFELTNTDEAIEKLSLLTASKTGYTDSAGGNLAILWHDPAGDLLGAVVLGSTQSGRFSDIITLHNMANLYIAIANSEPSNCK